MDPRFPPTAIERGGIRTGVLKGVRPLHGVTGAPRRREGVWPPSGSPAVILWATSNSHPLRQTGKCDAHSRAVTLFPNRELEAI